MPRPMPTIANPPTASPVADDERAYYALSRRVYGSWFADVYDTICWPLRGLRSRVARLAGIQAGTRAIDVATGTGSQARAFADAGASVVAIDLSPRMLSIARRKHHDRNIEFVVADATSLPSPDASFDISCVSFALHEMPRVVRARVVGNMARVTRLGGKLVIVDHALPRNRVSTTWSSCTREITTLTSSTRISARYSHGPGSRSSPSIAPCSARRGS
jgi:ubiquinone/menaquinone biosynthesis C-methylase UbiE